MALNGWWLTVSCRTYTGVALSFCCFGLGWVEVCCFLWCCDGLCCAVLGCVVRWGAVICRVLLSSLLCVVLWCSVVFPAAIAVEHSGACMAEKVKVYVTPRRCIRPARGLYCISWQRELRRIAWRWALPGTDSVVLSLDKPYRSSWRRSPLALFAGTRICLSLITISCTWARSDDLDTVP